MTQTLEKRFEKTAKKIESVLSSLDVECEAEIDEEHETIVWKFLSNKAQVFVLLTPLEDQCFVQVRSLVVSLPPSGILPLYRRLLELNGERHLGASFGVSGRYVILGTGRIADKIDKDELESMILAVAEGVAIHEDELVVDFDCGRPIEEEPEEDD